MNGADLRQLLVVSKSASALECLQAVAHSNAWHLEHARSGWEALERVQSGGQPDMVLVDLAEQDSGGLHTLRWLRRLRPELPVLVLTPTHDLEQKTESIRLGALEYLVTPLNDSQMEFAIRRHLSFGDEQDDFEVTGEEIEEVGEGDFFIAASPAMHRLRTQAGLLAQLDVPVLIYGEAGCGKESLARLIHKLSLRSGFRFLKLNCAALSEDALESELFGSDGNGKANLNQRPARFELCNKGTLLLNEVAELPPGLQSTLLQALQEKQYPGHDGALKLDVRIIATSSADIARMLAAKTLRQDFYYHVSAFTMHVPPLRERKREIPLLLGHFMSQIARHYGLQAGHFSSELAHACQNYSWPGNLTQMESFVKRYLVTRDEEAALSEIQNGPGLSDENHANGVDHSEMAPHTGLKSLVQNVKGEAERNAIVGALEQTHWNRRAAARLLQVSYRTLLYKIQQYNLSPAGYSSHNGNGHRGNGSSR